MRTLKINNNTFEDIKRTDKMIEIAEEEKREVTDNKLSYYACYLIVQNSDPKKRSNSTRSNILCYSNTKTCLG